MLYPVNRHRLLDILRVAEREKRGDRGHLQHGSENEGAGTRVGNDAVRVVFTERPDQLRQELRRRHDASFFPVIGVDEIDGHLKESRRARSLVDLLVAKERLVQLRLASGVGMNVGAEIAEDSAGSRVGGVGDVFDQQLGRTLLAQRGQRGTAAGGQVGELVVVPRRLDERLHHSVHVAYAFLHMLLRVVGQPVDPLARHLLLVAPHLLRRAVSRHHLPPRDCGVHTRLRARKARAQPLRPRVHRPPVGGDAVLFAVEDDRLLLELEHRRRLPAVLASVGLAAVPSSRPRAPVLVLLVPLDRRAAQITRRQLHQHPPEEGAAHRRAQPQLERLHRHLLHPVHCEQRAHRALRRHLLAAALGRLPRLPRVLRRLEGVAERRVVRLVQPLLAQVDPLDHPIGRRLAQREAASPHVVAVHVGHHAHVAHAAALRDAKLEQQPVGGLARAHQRLALLLAHDQRLRVGLERGVPQSEHHVVRRVGHQVGLVDHREARGALAKVADVALDAALAKGMTARTQPRHRDEGVLAHGADDLAAKLLLPAAQH
mmetsp:Transcript_15253/g.36539  ORF Transcript_15253/g.36539 Transcript_15253/m.36539 type:complete len:543 (+) Transcript_15253:670-2298(+)